MTGCVGICTLATYASHASPARVAPRHVFVPNATGLALQQRTTKLLPVTVGYTPVAALPPGEREVGGADSGPPSPTSPILALPCHPLHRSSLGMRDGGAKPP